MNTTVIYWKIKLFLQLIETLAAEKKIKNDF